MLARSSGLLEGGLVAALRLHAGSSCQVTCAAYTREQGGRITQLQYLLQLSLRTSEKPQKAKFAEFIFRDCMKSPQTRARRLLMRRIMAAYTNASPLAHNLS